MLIDMQHISLRIGSRTILNDISVQIEAGKIIGLIGPNGAGKTSLLKILANVQNEYTGNYDFSGKPIQHYTLKQLAKAFAYLAQDATAHWPLKVEKLIALGRIPFQGMSNRLNSNDYQAIQKAVIQTDIEHLLGRIVTELSGGERARVFLARLFAAEPSVIFLDEPIAALDPYHQLHVMEILKEHAANGGTVVIVLHDLNLAARFCDELILMDKGTIAAQGKIDDLLKNQLLEDIYGIQLKMFCQDDAYAITPWKRRTKTT
jgi:iron complex transport system ATP-binding protein